VPITEVMQAASDVRSTPHSGRQLYPLIAAAVNKVKRRKPQTLKAQASKAALTLLPLQFR
jgi:hypothetical protein